MRGGDGLVPASHGKTPKPRGRGRPRPFFESVFLAGRLRTACTTSLLLLLLARPAAVQAQFTYTTNNGTITITGYTGPGGDVTIPDTINGLPVTAIGGNYSSGYWAGAFYQRTSLTSVTIPNSVTSIGEYAFYECTSLTSVTIPNSVTSIEYAAFSGCALTSITIPNSITSIADTTFAGCYSLTNLTIPTSVTNIGFDAFSACPSLTSVAIPSSVTSIGGYAFSGCGSLSAITVDALNPAYSSVDGVLFDKSQTTLIQCPGGKTGSYTIPNSVTNLSDAFRFCDYLTRITIPDTVVKIESYTFQDCVSLTNVTIPGSVTRIGGAAFTGCISLIGLTIPNSVTSIGDNAFAYCHSLASITIPPSVTNLGSGVFGECASLEAITVDASNPAYSSVEGILFDKSKTTLIECPGTKAGSYTVPNGVTTIQGSAFDACKGLTIVTIPSSVTDIGDGAFFGCSSLKEFYFLGNAPSLGGRDVFNGISNATVYYLPGTGGWSSAFGGVAAVMVNSPNPGGSMKVNLFPGCVASAGAQWYVDGGIPQPSGATVLGLLVGNHTVSFSNIVGWITPSNQTVSVSANATATAIGSYVADPYPFPYTTNNNTVTIQGYTGPDGIVTIPNTIECLPVTSIGSQAFAGCTSPTTVTIPNSVTSIGDAAFGGCTSLTNLSLGNSVTSIGGGAFEECSSLTSVTIPNSATSIGTNAFYYCTGLTSVTIPNGLTSIRDSTFYYCTKLTSVTIPISVASIGDSAFSGCLRLTGVYFLGNAPSLGGPFVLEGDTHATVYYLPGTSGWGSTFGGRPTALWFLPNPLILTGGPGFGVQSNAFGFITSWGTNLPVVVEACTNPANHSWSPVQTNALTDGWSYFSDPQWANSPARFYRIRSP